MRERRCRFTATLWATRIARQLKKWRRWWTLLDARQEQLIRGISYLAACGCGFDSHRPLQKP
jgi:hypothetical protein